MSLTDGDCAADRAGLYRNYSIYVSVSKFMLFFGAGYVAPPLACADRKQLHPPAHPHFQLSRNRSTSPPLGSKVLIWDSP